MSKYYNDYVWKRGIPYGIKPSTQGTTYKIVSDPYHKRISIEEYLFPPQPSSDTPVFVKTIYDSALFDFRQLLLGEQIAWQKSLIAETASSATCHIRNQDDRLVLIEEYTFTDHRCRECRSFSPQGILLSTQKIYYQTESMAESFNGVILFDANNRPVMQKKYNIDKETDTFTDLIEAVS